MLTASSLDGASGTDLGLEDENRTIWTAFELDSDADLVDLILFSWNDLDADLDDLDCFDADLSRPGPAHGPDTGVDDLTDRLEMVWML